MPLVSVGFILALQVLAPTHGILFQGLQDEIKSLQNVKSKLENRLSNLDQNKVSLEVRQFAVGTHKPGYQIITLDCV